MPRDTYVSPDTNFEIPRDLGPNFVASDITDSTIELQVTEWKVDLHQGEVADNSEEESEQSFRNMRKMNEKRQHLQPYGSITGLKLRQSGKKVHVRDAGWFIISKNWSGAQAMERALRLEKAAAAELASKDLLTKNPEMTEPVLVAYCNTTTIGQTFHVSCPTDDAADVVIWRDFIRPAAT